MELETNIEKPKISTTGAGILKALAYSSVFSYPLTRREIIEKMPVRLTDNKSFDRELTRLREANFVWEERGFFGLKATGEIESRIDRNTRAKRYLGIGKSMSRFIGNFPFVRAVFLSGSISKNCMSADSDIDYFIITEPGRLWLCRTALIAFKKIFLLNSYKIFCINYLIDSDHLLTKDQNLYTAHEIRTLIPTYGKKFCLKYLAVNRDWTENYLPNSLMANCNSVPETKIRGLKWIFEKILSGSLGNRLEVSCRRWSEKYWRKKFSDAGIKNMEDVYVSSENVSVYHPENFKVSILKHYGSALKNLGRNPEIKLY